MSVSLFLSSMARAMTPRVAAVVAAGLLFLWITAVTAYWYRVVVPGVRKLNQSETDSKDTVDKKADNRLPVTLITGFLGSGAYRNDWFICVV